ncbi:Odorant-binding protein 50c-1 [Drosophila willistoni]|nr:Odorant-binding protein 50c-1 [Drosophila willistoni]
MTFEAFKSQCGKYMPAGSPRLSPCLYECIFNASNTLDGTEINVQNARNMMQKILGNNQGFTDAYTEGLENCSNFVDEMMKYSRRRPPALPGVECSFECVFNNTQSLNGTSLVLPKVEQLLQIALNGDQKVIDIYMNGFRECSMQEAEMLRSLKRRRMEVVDNCSPMAVTYAICAHRYVNINCPEGSWTNSQQCNEAKDYSINCNMPKGRKAT